MKYQIVPYSPEFKGQVLEVQKHLWGPDPVQNAEYFDWKYIRNPNQDSPFVHLALCDGKVVGMRGLMQAKWQVGYPPQTFILPVAGDLVIAPEHRNQGLFSKIMQSALNDLADKEVPYVFNFSAGKVTKLGSLAMGWRSTPSLKMLSRPNHMRRIGRRLSVFSSARRPDPFYSFDKNGSPSPRNTGSSVVFEKAPRPKAMADLIKENGYDGRIRQVRDEPYFAWRFNNPRSEYRFIFGNYVFRLTELTFSSIL